MIWLVATSNLPLKVAPGSSTGRKSRLRACVFRASKSSPARRKRSTATSRCIQLSSGTRSAAAFSRTMSNCGPAQLLLTVAQPYEAGAVSCTMMTPAAP